MKLLLLLSVLLVGCDSSSQSNLYTSPEYRQLRYDIRLVCAQEQYDLYTGDTNPSIHPLVQFVKDQNKFEKSTGLVAPSKSDMEGRFC